MKSNATSQPPTRSPAVRRRIWLLAAAFILVELIVLPGAASPFRIPKSVVALCSVLLVVGLSLAVDLLRGRLALRWSPLASVLVALPLLQAVSMIWSGSPRLAFEAALHTSIWVAGALWIATTAAVERRRLADAAVLGATVSALVLVAQAAGLALVSLGPDGPTGRLALIGLTGNPADLSMAAVLLLPLMLAAPESTSRRWYRRIAALLLTGAAVVSQTLTGLVGLVAVWGIWIIQKRSLKVWALAAAAVVALGAIGMSTGLDRRFERQIRILKRGNWYVLLSARGDGWTAAAEMLRQRPVVGHGASNYTYAYYPARIAWLERTGSVGNRAELATHFRFAHCDPLQVGAELGIAGLGWMIALGIAVFRGRTRGDPLPALAFAAVGPFAVLHFPTQIAVGLLPITLIMANLLAGGREIVIEPGRWPRRAAALVIAVLVLVGAYWQLHRLMLNLWRGGLVYALATVERLDEPQRSRRAAVVESQILPRIQALPGARAWLWRLVGQARVARGDDLGAETAFRNAMELWPHEEAEFGLGLALAAQDRRLRAQGLELDARNLRGTAIVHLARVCRTNPALLELIADPDLRSAVAEIVDAAGARRPRPRSLDGR